VGGVAVFAARMALRFFVVFGMPIHLGVTAFPMALALQPNYAVVKNRRASGATGVIYQ